MRRSIFSGCLLAFALLASSCSQKVEPPQAPAPPDHRVADAAAIRAIDADWAKAAAAREPGAFTAFYADDAVLLPPGEPMASGKQAIAEAWRRISAQPGFALTFAPSKVEVARSGELAYEIGDYEVTRNDTRGRPQTSKGKYLVVWGKQADGSWKAVVDAPTTAQ